MPEPIFSVYICTKCKKLYNAKAIVDANRDVNPLDVTMPCCGEFQGIWYTSESLIEDLEELRAEDDAE